MKRFKLMLKTILLSTLVFMFILNYIPRSIIANAATTVEAGDSDSEDNTKENNLLDNLKQYNKNEVNIQLVRINDGQIFISGILSDKKTPSVESALKFLDQNKSILGIQSIDNNFKQSDITTDEIGYKHIKLDQFISGLPVVGKNLTVHFNKDGIITAITGNISSVNQITKLGDKSITSSEAIGIAKNQFVSTNSSEQQYGKTKKQNLNQIIL